MATQHDENAAHELSEILARFKADPAVCPGYGPEKSCAEPAAFLQWLQNDPSAYCEKHALHAAMFWDSMGFPPPTYIRLSDGRHMSVTLARKDAPDA